MNEERTEIFVNTQVRRADFIYFNMFDFCMRSADTLCVLNQNIVCEPQP